MKKEFYCVVEDVSTQDFIRQIGDRSAKIKASAVESATRSKRCAGRSPSIPPQQPPGNDRRDRIVFFSSAVTAMLSAAMMGVTESTGSDGCLGISA